MKKERKKLLLTILMSTLLVGCGPETVIIGGDDDEDVPGGSLTKTYDFETALARDYSNCTIYCGQQYADGEGTQEDWVFMYDEYEIIYSYTDAANGYDPLTFYSTYDGQSVLWFEKDYDYLRSAWVHDGFMGIEYDIRNNVFYMPDFLDTISVDDCTYALGQYYVTDAAKIEELNMGVFGFAWYNDLSSFIIQVTEDNYIHRIWGYDNPDDPNDENLVLIEISDVGTTVVGDKAVYPCMVTTSQLPPKPAADNVTNWIGLTGRDTIPTYVKSFDLFVVPEIKAGTANWMIDGKDSGVALTYHDEDVKPTITIDSTHHYRFHNVRTNVTVASATGSELTKVTESDVEYWAIGGQKTFVPVVYQDTLDETPALSKVDGYWALDGVKTSVEVMPGSNPSVVAGTTNWLIMGEDSGIALSYHSEAVMPTVSTSEGYYVLSNVATEIAYDSSKGAVINKDSGYWTIGGDATFIPVYAHSVLDEVPAFSIVNNHWALNGTETTLNAKNGDFDVVIGLDEFFELAYTYTLEEDGKEYVYNMPATWKCTNSKVCSDMSKVDNTRTSYKYFYGLTPGEVEISVSTIGKDNTTVKSNIIKVKVEADDPQDVEGACYDITIGTYTVSEVDNPKGYGTFGLDNEADGMDFGDVPAMMGNKAYINQAKNTDTFPVTNNQNYNIVYLQPTEGIFSKDLNAYVTFDFSGVAAAPTVNRISFLYAVTHEAHYLNLETIDEFEIKVSNDGNTWTSFDVLDEMKSTISQYNLKVMDVEFNGNYSYVRIEMGAYTLGRNFMFGMSSIHFWSEQ